MYYVQGLKQYKNGPTNGLIGLIERKKNCQRKKDLTQGYTNLNSFDGDNSQF